LMFVVTPIRRRRSQRIRDTLLRWWVASVVALYGLFIIANHFAP
jgi:hypothetical protein